MNQFSEWLKAGGRFVLASLQPVRRWNALVSWTGLGLIITLSSWIAARSTFGTTPAIVGGLTLLTILFLLQGARLERLLHGAASFGSLHPADTEGDLKRGGVIRLKFRNSGRRAEFRAVARWLDSESMDFGYSPWDLKWANDSTTCELPHESDGYLLPARVTRNHGGTHTLYQLPESASETPKHKSVEEDHPLIEVRLIRKSPEAESRWIVGFESKNGDVRPVLLDQG